MGDVIRLAERRAAREARRRGPRRAPRASSSCSTCVVRSRTSRPSGSTGSSTRWSGRRPPRRASAAARWPPIPEALAEYRRSAERRALELRLPLIWPERFPEEVPAAMRAAHYAAEQGRGAAFVLAAGRLAFCGGFDLDDPELLAEAAAAAGIDMQGWLHALGEVAATARSTPPGARCWPQGADRLPALRVGDTLFWGEHRIDEAAAAARHLAARARRALRADEPGEDAGVRSPPRAPDRRPGSRGGSGPRDRTRAGAARGPR